MSTASDSSLNLVKTNTSLVNSIMHLKDINAEPVLWLSINAFTNEIGCTNVFYLSCKVNLCRLICL